MELKKLNGKIKSLATKTSKWRDEVQVCLVGCAQFAFDDNNASPATDLVHAVKGADAKAVIHWMEKHMPVIWVGKEEKFRFNKSFLGEYDAVTLLSEPWWEHATKARDVVSSIDCLDAVRSMIKRLEKEIKSGEKTVKHADLIASLVATTNAYEFAKK